MLAATGQPLYSNPGAGVDVEPEGGYVANVLLENCRLVDNAGQGLVSDRYGNGPPTTRHIVLRGCLLWGVTNWAAWVRQTDFRFENCRLYGAFTTGCAVAGYATRFVGCTFEDRPYHGQPAYGQYLVYSNHEARALHFTNCRFVGTRNYLLFAHPVAPDPASSFRLRNCTFTLDNAEPPLGSTDQLAGVVFSGATVFADGPHRTGWSARAVVLGAAGVPGSAAVLAGGSLRLLAAGRYRLPAGLAVGRLATIVVGTNAGLVVEQTASPAAELYIGHGARLLVRKGGSLEIRPHTKVTIAGQLLVEDGAYFCADSAAVIATVGRGRLRLRQPASKSRQPTLKLRQKKAEGEVKSTQPRIFCQSS